MSRLFEEIGEDKILVISSKHCPVCTDLKKKASKDPLLSKSLVFKDVETDDIARQIAEAFRLDAVPSFFRIIKDGDKIYTCKLNRDNLTVIEDCMETEEKKE